MTSRIFAPFPWPWTLFLNNQHLTETWKLMQGEKSNLTNVFTAYWTIIKIMNAAEAFVQLIYYDAF